MKRPFGPTEHGAIDYAFVAILALGPRIFGLNTTARNISYGFAAAAGLLNGATAHGLSPYPAIPAKLHGQADVPFIPVLLLLPWVTGALKRRNARRFFACFFLLALTNFLLTDYDAPASDWAPGRD